MQIACYLCVHCASAREYIFSHFYTANLGSTAKNNDSQRLDQYDSDCQMKL